MCERNCLTVLEKSSKEGDCRVPVFKAALLSVREEQVVNLVCKAKLNKEIAYELHHY